VNAAQQEIVQMTFARLAVMPEVAGALFYERLFAVNPSFRPLSKNDMRIQGVKLMTMLAMVVYNLHEPGQVLPAIRDLGLQSGRFVSVALYPVVVRGVFSTSNRKTMSSIPVRFIDIISMDGLGCGLGGQRFALPTTPQLQQKNCSIDRIEGS